MPPPKHRKKTFSAKLRKERNAKRVEKKRNEDQDEREEEHIAKECFGLDSDDEGGDDVKGTSLVRKMNEQPGAKLKGDKSYDANRYRLHFLQESQADLEKRKAKTRLPYQQLPEEALEVDLDDIYQPGTVLDMPKRPCWNSTMSKTNLETQEELYFKKYLDRILEKHSPENLSYFELNLETWRQLWRVLEMADIVLLITDIRHPALHFSPAFYNYVVNEQKKPLILVLNKIDLAPPALVIAWKRYFKIKFPDIHVIYFTSYPKDQSQETTSDPGKVLHKRRKRRAFAVVGPQQLLEACHDICSDKVDLSSWRDKIEGEIAGVDSEHEVRIKMEEVPDTSHHIPYRDDVLTIGCCGYTNVGKSSLMNGLMGKKVVSVSRTPGHTKHFQTIYLTPTVKMCDSPGLVFPSLVPKPMQILAGIYPIAQVREPYTAIQYLAERLDLPLLLRLQHPDYVRGSEKAPPRWSAFDICDAWAEKRGFLTARAARNDTYRAANHLLRLAVDGRLCLCTRPPEYSKLQDEWALEEDTEEVRRLQSLHQPLTDLDHLHNDLDLDTDENANENEKEEEEDVVISSNNPFALLDDDE